MFRGLFEAFRASIARLTGTARVLVGLTVASALVGEITVRTTGFPLYRWLGVSGVPRFALAFQWFTHPLAEVPNDAFLFGLALDCFGFALMIPDFEALYGRRALLRMLLASTLARGFVGAAMVVGYPDLGGSPVAGMTGLLFTLIGAQASLDGGRRRFGFPGGGSNAPTVIEGRHVLGLLAFFLVVSLIASRQLLPFVADAVAIAVGVFLPPPSPKPRRSFRVVKGGRLDDSGERMLHRAGAVG